MRKVNLLATGLIVVACAAVNLSIKQDRIPNIVKGPAAPTSAVLAADPMNQLNRLSQIPCLLVFDDKDPVVDSAQNEIAAAHQLGPNCQVVLFHGRNHADPRIMDPSLVVRFVSRLPRNHTVVLLHGWGRHGTDWFEVPPGHEQDAPVIEGVRLGKALQGRFKCIAEDFGGNSWGNDDAISQLERVTRSTGPVILVSSSMGGVLMWRFAERYPSRVVGLVGLSPVCNLKAMCNTQFGKNILRAYETQ